MDIYLVSLLFGGIGLAAMGLLGLGSHGHGGHSSHGGHATGHGHGGHGSHAAGHGHSSSHSHSASHGSVSPLWQLMSPRIIFALLFGFGAVGLALRSFVGGMLLLGGAIVGGLLAERFVVMPLWNVLMRFGSNPALTLESAVMSEARVVSAFNDKGQGMVAIEVDGQLIQLLAKLGANELVGEKRLRPGDTVRIEEIDAARNRCTVTRNAV